MHYFIPAVKNFFSKFLIFFQNALYSLKSLKKNFSEKAPRKSFLQKKLSKNPKQETPLSPLIANLST